MEGEGGMEGGMGREWGRRGERKCLGASAQIHVGEVVSARRSSRAQGGMSRSLGSESARELYLGTKGHSAPSRPGARRRCAARTQEQHNNHAAEHARTGVAEERGECIRACAGAVSYLEGGREHLRAPAHAGAAQHARRSRGERTQQSMQAREREGKQPGGCQILPVKMRDIACKKRKKK